MHVMWLLCCLMYGNSYVKNAARQTPGLVGSLMRVMRENAIGGQQDVAVSLILGTHLDTHVVNLRCQQGTPWRPLMFVWSGV